MKRRVLAAVLFVLALAIVVSLLPSAARKDVETTVGGHWTGRKAVTRTVAQLVAGRRIERRQPAALDPDAGFSREPAGEAIREKPEPGEEPQPTRTAATPAPQQRTGRSAIGPRSSLSEGLSFLGADSNDSGFIPPDSMGAVGPTQILVSLNGVIRLFDKDGNSDPNLDMTDQAFWAPVRNGFDVTDPGVEYDRLSQRWILSAINIKSTGNRVMLAVSDGPTITDETSFDFFFFQENSGFATAQPARFADYPQLGVDKQAVYIGVNEFASSSGSFTATNLYVIQKSSVTGGGPIDVTGFRTCCTGGQGLDSPEPATNMEPSIDAGYVVGPDNLIANRLDVRRVTFNVFGVPSLSGNLMVPIPATAQPLPVPAQGTTGDLDALDDRLFEAMVAQAPDGTDSLWTAHNIRVNSSGVGSLAGDRDGARWYELGDLGSDPPTLVQSGTLFDTALSNPRFFWIPSIAMNGQGHASLNASTAGIRRFAGVASSGRLASDPLDTTETFDLTQSSSNSYNLGPDAPRRWGDYSQTVVDPTDNQTFWTFQEYTKANNVWGVRVIQLKPPPPAVPANASPDTVPIDTDPHPVQISGISTGGAGFFDPTDPGSPYPGYEHISATVSNGVVVNSVTVTDPTDPIPTHLTLDLDTSGATPGFASITITNPDGQSTTCSNALIVGSDSTPPSTPNPQGTSPPSPANDNLPKVFGSGADCGSDVSVYKDDPTCTDPPAATGPATEFASPGISATVNDNTTTDFYAKATSVADVDSACSPTPVNYVEDSVPPQVSVDSGPTGTTTDQAPTFTFSGSDTVGPVTFECSIDTGAPSFGPCSGPGNSDTPTSALGDGSYTFRVQATDAAGNSSVATRSFTVETAKPLPDTTIKGPKKTHKARPKFKFSSTDPAATFRCKLDRGQFVPCTSSFRTPRLSPGKHKLKVIAVGSGGADATPAVRKFRVLPPA